MKTIINRDETTVAILLLKPEFHQIVKENDITVVGTAMGDDVTRSICIVKDGDIAWAKQKLNETGQFMTHFLPLPVEILKIIALTEVEEEAVVKEKK